MEHILNDLNLYFETKKANKLRKTLTSIIKNQNLSRTEIYDLFGNLSGKDPEFFMDKVYPAMMLQFRKYSPQEFKEMDEYILKKYCFAPNEDIIMSSHGNIMEKKVSSTGRIYVTNYRIVLSGTQTVRSAQKQMGGRPSGLISMAVRGSITKKRKNIRKAITQALRSEMAQLNMAEWGYFFPIVNATSIKMTKKYIEYTVIIETEQKPFKMYIKVIPSKYKKQPKDEFLLQQKAMIDKVEALVLQYRVPTQYM